MLNMTENGNGNGNGNVTPLPAGRLALVEQANRIAQETAAERDELREEVERLKLRLTDCHVRETALQSLITEMESRVNSMMAVRDQAVARTATLTSLHTSVLAMMRAHEIPNAPLVQGTDEANAHVGSPGDVG